MSGGARRRSAPWLLAIAVGAIALAATVSCQEPTVISLVVETDIPCTTVRRAGVTITTGPTSPELESLSPTTVAQSCSERTGTLNLVGDLTLKRGGGDDVALRIVLGVDGSGVTENDCQAPAYAGCIVARRQLRYVSHQRLRLPISLREVCKGNPCDVGQTCVRGTCVTSEIKRSELCTGEGCDESVLTASGGADVDAGLDDSGASDAPVDAAADVTTTTTDKLVAGFDHACLLRGGEVRCWGANESGQLARPALADGGGLPLTVALPRLAIDVTAGRAHTCAILDDNTVWCWGANDVAQTGDPDAGGAVTSPAQIPGLSGAVEIAAGSDHTCARFIGNVVRCWGASRDDQLGGLPDSGIPLKSPPILVEGLPTSAAAAGLEGVTAGDGLSCVRIVDKLWCWGTGPWTGFASGAPATPTKADSWAELAIGKTHACGVQGGAKNVSCWGYNDVHQVGPANDATPVPSPRSTSSRALQLSIKDRHTCGIDPGGGVPTLVCWGNNAEGQLGPAATPQSDPTPRAVPLSSVPVRAAAGATFSCALLDTGVVQCWGDNEKGQLGNIGAGSGPTPVVVQLD